ncbi:hypothetical protein ACWGE0_03110 [Lentzea sp. NPDC054927]
MSVLLAILACPEKVLEKRVEKITSKPLKALVAVDNVKGASTRKVKT